VIIQADATGVDALRAGERDRERDRERERSVRKEREREIQRGEGCGKKRKDRARGTNKRDVPCFLGACRARK